MRMLLSISVAIALTSTPALSGDATAEVSRVLDDFHAAAAAADAERYFGHFTPDAVFLGTDGSERWTVAEFRKYADPHFSAGSGWTYVATERHVMFSPDGSLAWFDEKLRNEKYGETRGTGVLRRTERGWKIAHYSLTFLVPNEKAAGVVELIRGTAPTPEE